MTTQSLQATPKQNAIAVILVLLIFLALWARFQFENSAYAIKALTVLDNTSTTLMTNVGNSIFVFDKSGRVKKSIIFNELGFEGTPVDIQVLSDDSFLIGIEETKSIYHCTISTTRCDKESIKLLQQVANIFRFEYLSVKGEYYISDTGNHRILYAKPSEGEEYVLSNPKKFKYPNEIAISENGEIYIVNNNHFEVGVYKHVIRHLNKEKTVFRTKNSYSRNSFPVDIALLDNGEIYVSIANYTLSAADVIGYSSQGNAKEKIKLEKSMNPAAITSFDRELIIAMPENYLLRAYDYEYQTLSNFGDSRLLFALRDVKNEKENFQRLSMLMLAVIILAGTGMIFLVVVISKSSKKNNVLLNVSDKAVVVKYNYNGIHWISPDAKLLRQNKMLLTVFPLLLIIMSLTMWYYLGQLAATSGKELPDGMLNSLLIFSIGFILLPVVGLKIAIPKMSNKLGTDGNHLYLETSKKEMFSYLPEELIVSHSKIYTDVHTISLRLGNGKALYDAAEIQQHIQPLLERARKYSAVNLFILRLRERRADAIFTLLLLLVVVILIANPGKWFPF